MQNACSIFPQCKHANPGGPGRRQPVSPQSPRGAHRRTLPLENASLARTVDTPGGFTPDVRSQKAVIEERPACAHTGHTPAGHVQEDLVTCPSGMDAQASTGRCLPLATWHRHRERSQLSARRILYVPCVGTNSRTAQTRVERETRLEPMATKRRAPPFRRGTAGAAGPCPRGTSFRRNTSWPGPTAPSKSSGHRNGQRCIPRGITNKRIATTKTMPGDRETGFSPPLTKNRRPALGTPTPAEPCSPAPPAWPGKRPPGRRGGRICPGRTHPSSSQCACRSRCPGSASRHLSP